MYLVLQSIEVDIRQLHGPGDSASKTQHARAVTHAHKSTGAKDQYWHLKRPLSLSLEHTAD